MSADPSRAAPQRPVILIPARIASTRLPGKPLADIAGLPMIVQVLRRAEEADLGPVWIACDDPGVEAAVADAGGRAVMTGLDHPSGSDRIFEALARIDPDRRFDAVINVQGDLPTLEAALPARALALLGDPQVDIATLAAAIKEPAERANPNVVKAVTAAPSGADHGRALYFTRATAPWGEGPLWHHIGLYAYRRDALERFVKLPPSPLELREKLEQLRALESGMRIEVAFVDTVPLGVDTPADLDRARAILAQRR
jgi:3-deoxy-manno-octulosonate cytidylyltransferase (CMP-KDO synthetase)